MIFLFLASVVAGLGRRTPQAPKELKAFLWLLLFFIKANWKKRKTKKENEGWNLRKEIKRSELYAKNHKREK